MKKRIIALALALVMAAGLVPSAAVFTDISDDSEQWAAETLASLGIVSSVDRFNPDASLTRAEFCKMAVLAAGFSEESLYASYTIFPDVLASSWYSAYVNAAVRKYQILQGYPSGLFMPDNSITYGEAATILVKMLGSTVEDVGYFWPRDYVLQAEQVGLARAFVRPEGRRRLFVPGLPRRRRVPAGRHLAERFLAGIRRGPPVRRR